MNLRRTERRFHVGRDKTRASRIIALASVPLLMFVVRDQRSRDRVLTEQDAAADRGLSAFRANVDLLHIGVDLPTATADMTVLRMVRAIAGLDVPSLPQDGCSEGRCGSGDTGPSSHVVPSAVSSSVLPRPCPLQ